MKPTIFTDTPGWEFRIDEVSANVFVARASDTVGRIVEKTGPEPDALLEKCHLEVKQTMATIPKSRK